MFRLPRRAIVSPLMAGTVRAIFRACVAIAGSTMCVLAAAQSPVTISLALKASTQAAATPTVGTVTVSDAAGPVRSGMVDIFDGTQKVQTLQLVSTSASGFTPGTAILRHIFAPGTHQLTAAFEATAADGAATSSGVALTVTPGTSTSTSTLHYAQTVDFSVNGAYNALDGVVVADLNNDGIPDIATVQVYPNALAVSLADKPGHYLPPTNLPIVSTLYEGHMEVLAADLDADGLVDLIVTGGGDNYTLFFRNNPAAPGTFLTPVQLIPNHGTPIAIADFNHDGLPDIAYFQGDALYSNPSYITVALNQKSAPGTFVSNVTTLPFSEYDIEKLITADMNGDGFPDLVIQTQTSSSANAYEFVVVLADPAHPGQFLSQTAYTPPASIYNIAVQDLNHDGLPDVVISGAANYFTVYLGDPAHPGQLLTPQNTAAPGLAYPVLVAVGDIDGNGIPDVISSDGNVLSIFSGKGDGTFVAPTTLLGGVTPPAWQIGAAIVTDLDGDGLNDLVTTEYDQNSAQIFLHNTQVVPPTLQTATDISVSPASGVVAFGTPITFTATESAFSGQPSGSVDFYDVVYFPPYSVIDTAPLVGNTATFTTTSLSIGYHDIVAVFHGNSVYAPSQSALALIQILPSQPPTVTNVSPNSGPAAGGTSVAITGTNFTGATGVQFGGAAATSFTVNSSTSIAAVSPAGTSVVDVTVATAGGTSALSAADRFTYNTVTALVEPVGTTSPLQNANVTFSASGTLGSIAVLTQGAPNLDFNHVQGGVVNPSVPPCVPGTNYAAGQICSVFFTFTPTHPGLRSGGITLMDSSGNLLANAYISGIGTGPQVNWLPGTQLNLGTSLSSPEGAAVDGNGDIYAVENGKLVEIAATGSVTYIVTFAGDVRGVAVDGSGNVFVVTALYSSNKTVVNEIMAVNGRIQAPVVIRTLATGFITLRGIAVDRNGNIFLTQFYTTGTDCAVYEIPAVNGNIPATPTVLTIATTFGAPACGPDGIAVDASGNLFVADDLNNVVYELLAVNGSVPASPTIRALGGGFNQPSGVALDAAGDVFVADYGNAVVKEIVAVNGSIPAANATILSLGSGLKGPSGLVVDASGNVFVSDYGLTQIVKLDYADPPSLFFATTAVGSTSTDSPKPLTIYNEGDEPLVFSAPVTGTNPAITSGFTIGSSSTCPQTVSAMLPFSLAVGGSCTYEISFSPASSGLTNGDLFITDNNLNTVNASQVIPLNGTATGAVALPTVTGISPNSGPAAGGTSVTITGTNFIGPTAVRFGSSVATSNTVSSTSIVAVSPPGTGTVDVNVTTSTGTSALSPSDQFTYIGSAQVINFNAPTQPAYVGTSVLLTATGGGSGNPVVFSVVSGPATVSGVHGSTLTYTAPGTVVVEADQAAGAGYPAAAPVQVTLAPVVLTVPIGGSSGPVSTLVTFQAAGTLAAVRSSTAGAAAEDFSVGTGGTCTLNTIYAAGQTCVEQFVLTPKYPGRRLGGVVFTTAAGNSLATAYTYGVGTGPQVTFSPGSQTTLSGTLNQPAGVAVDGSGDIFVAVAGGSGGLWELPGGGSPVQIGALGPCQDVTVDGVGNVFVLSNKTTLSEVIAANGKIPNNPTIVTITSQLNNATSVKVDGLGNVYISSVASAGLGGGVDEVLAVDGTIPATPTILTLTSAFSGATGVAVDASGDLFVTDELQNAVFEVMAVNGSIPASPTIRTLAMGIVQPSNVTLDPAGDVLVSVYGNGDVQELLAVNGTVPAGNPAILTLGSGFIIPQGLCIDQYGNVYVADAGLPQAVKLDLADASTLNFATTPVGQTSSDSPKTVTLENIGNAPLAFTIPTTGFNTNPYITPGFTVGGASTCPQLGPASAPGQLAPGASCTDLVNFTPVQAGNNGGAMYIQDNALNVAGTDQVVPLNGIGIDLTTTLTFNVANQVLGTPPFTVAATSNSPGAITYSVVSGPATISGSTVSLTAAGTVTLLASQAASGAYPAVTATATFTVAKQPQTITFAPLASPVATTAPPIALVATATSGLPVSFSVVSGPGTVNGALLTVTGSGTIVVAANQPGNAQFAAAPAVTQTVTVDPALQLTLSATPNPVFLNNPVTLTAVLAMPAGPAPTGVVTFYEGTRAIGSAGLNNTMASIAVSTLSLGSHTITASYSGSTFYAPTVSAPGVVVVEDFTLTLANPELTIFHGGTGTFLLNVTAPSSLGMAATVNLTASGAPTGSVVTFTPATIATGSASTAVSLVIQTPNYPAGPWQVGSLRAPGTLMAALLLAGLWLPDRRRLRRVCGMLLVAMALAGISGCGSGWKTQVWTIDITAASGQLSHSVTATLTSKCQDGQSACPVVSP